MADNFSKVIRISSLTEENSPNWSRSQLSESSHAFLWLLSRLASQTTLDSNGHRCSIDKEASAQFVPFVCGRLKIIPSLIQHQSLSLKMGFCERNLEESEVESSQRIFKILFSIKNTLGLTLGWVVWNWVFLFLFLWSQNRNGAQWKRQSLLMSMDQDQLWLEKPGLYLDWWSYFWPTNVW